MKTFRVIAALVLLVALIIWAVYRFIPRAGEPSFEPDQIERLAYLAGKWDAARTLADRDASFQDLDRYVADLRAAGRDPLSVPEVWWEVFRHRYFHKFEGAPARPGGRLRFEIDDRKPTVAFQILVPESYSASTSAPLVVCLDPARNGDGPRPNLPLPEAVRNRAFLVVPEGPWNPAASRADAIRLHAALNGAFQSAVFDRFNVDRNRMFLDSGATGASIAWRLAGRSAEAWAGVIIRGNLPPAESRFKNYSNTPFLLIAVPGQPLDPATAPALAYNMKEEGGAVTVINVTAPDWQSRSAVEAPEVSEPLLAFLEKVRNPYPSTLNWLVEDPATRRTFWLESTGEFDHPDAERNLVPPGFQANVTARFNQVEITAHRIVGFKIDLNDRILDLDRRVRIVVNGKEVYKSRPPRQLRTLLEKCSAAGDWTRVYPVAFSVENPDPR